MFFVLILRMSLIRQNSLTRLHEEAGAAEGEEPSDDVVPLSPDEIIDKIGK